MKKIIYSGVVVIFLFLILVPISQAEKFFYLKQIKYPLSNDYILTSPDEEVTLKVLANSISEDLIVKMMNIVDQKRIKNYFTYPSDVNPASDLYFVKFTPQKEGNFSIQPEVTIKYEADDKYKEVYFYNKTNLKFEKLESIRDGINQILTFTLPDKKTVMFALFNESALVGKASWYVYPKYQGELITASRDFAKGSQLKVTNLYNNKEVIVTVQDYGPKKCLDWTEKEQELMGPCQERILDLSKTAFLQLATSTGQGIISNIKVEPLE